MKKYICLFLSIITLFSSIVFLFLYCEVRNLNEEIYSQENMKRIIELSVKGKQYNEKINELITLYISEDYSEDNYNKINESAQTIIELEKIEKLISSLLPIQYPDNNENGYSICTEIFSVTKDLSEWREKALEYIEKINNSSGYDRQIIINNKKSLDSMRRNQVLAINKDLELLKSEWIDECTAVYIEKREEMQMSDEYIIAFIGYAIISCFSLLIFVCLKKEKNKIFIIIDLFMILLFSLYTIFSICFA